MRNYRQGCVLLRAEPEDLAGTCKSFDLFSDDVNASVIAGIEFEDHLLVVFAVDFTGDSQDR